MQTRGPIPFLSLAIISLALHFALIIFLFILYFLGFSDGWQSWSTAWRVLPEHQWMLMAFGPLSLSMAGLALFFPKISPLKDAAAPTAGAVTPSSGLFYNFTPLTPAVHTNTIIRMALAESVAIFGFVLGFLNRAPLVAVPFIVFALIVQFTVGPLFGKMAGRSAAAP